MERGSPEASAWAKLSENERLILRDCYGVLRLAGRSLYLLQDDLGDVMLGIRRSEMAPIHKELEAMSGELEKMSQRMQELQGRLQVLSKTPGQ